MFIELKTTTIIHQKLSCNIFLSLNLQTMYVALEKRRMLTTVPDGCFTKVIL